MCVQVYFEDALRQGQVITLFKEREVANMTREDPQGYEAVTIHHNTYWLLTWWLQSQEELRFTFTDQKPKKGIDDVAA